MVAATTLLPSSRYITWLAAGSCSRGFAPLSSSPLPLVFYFSLHLLATTLMEALVSTDHLSFPLSSLPTKRSISLTKPISLNPFPLPKSSLSSTSIKSPPRAPSSASSTTSSDPPAPKTEAEEPKERFDWFANWYPLAPVCDLDKRVPHGKRVLGLDVVVWWDRVQEKWQVFNDVCPHRLAPLSEGRIDQWGRLQCVYHGWCFDGAGDCKFIPQAPPDGPPVNTFKKACASVYPSCEQNKMVWFWPSTDPKYVDVLSKKKPPYIPELDDPSFTSSFGIRDIPYGYEVLIENLMDPAHVPYAHYGIMPMPKDAKKSPRVKLDREGGRPMEMAIQNLDVTGFLAKLEYGYGTVLAKQEYGYSKFIAPCIFYTNSKWEPQGNGSTKEEAAVSINQGEKRSLLIFISIPVSPGQSRFIWVFPRNFSVWMDRLIPRWVFHVGQNLILDSDLPLLHVEERKIADVGNSNWLKACFVPTKSDALVVGFRRWLKRYGSGEVPWGPKFGEGLPPTPPREQLLDRYRSHVVHCSSCRAAEKGLKVAEISLQVFSIGLIGVVAAMKHNRMSFVARSVVISFALACFLASKTLANYVYKTFHYHDYNHAIR